MTNGEMTMPCKSKNVNPDNCALEFNNWSGSSFTTVIKFELEMKFVSQSGIKINKNATVEAITVDFDL